MLLTTVLYRKHSGGKEFVMVDAGMNDLVRPSHYKAYHEIVELEAAGRPAAPRGCGGAGVRDRRFSGPRSRAPRAGARASGWRCWAPAPTASSWRPTTTRGPRPPEVMVDEGRWCGGAAAEDGGDATSADELFRRPLGSDVVAQPSRRHSDHRLRVPVHPAHRPPGARGSRLLRDPSSIRTVEWIREWKPKGIILSGGPNSVYEDERAHRRSRNCSSWACRCWASATGCSCWRTCPAATFAAPPAGVRPGQRQGAKAAGSSRASAEARRRRSG